jgi:ADP-ribose pyrophosphatase
MTNGRHRPWIVKSRQSLLSGGPIREIALERVELPDGRELADYYTIRLADYALVFALAPAGVLVLRQYRHGLKRTCLGFPGGAIDEGEQPLDAARRELLEEAGYASDDWHSLGGFVTNANQGCNTAHLFVAKNCRRVAVPHAPDVEQAELLVVPIDELLTPSSVEEIGQASHVALLTLATHPQLRRLG